MRAVPLIDWCVGGCAWQVSILVGERELARALRLILLLAFADWGGPPQQYLLLYIYALSYSCSRRILIRRQAWQPPQCTCLPGTLGVYAWACCRFFPLFDWRVFHVTSLS